MEKVKYLILGPALPDFLLPIDCCKMGKRILGVWKGVKRQVPFCGTIIE